MRITGSFVSALKASVERFENPEVGIITWVVGVGARFGDNRSVLVKEHYEESGDTVV